MTSKRSISAKERLRRKRESVNRAIDQLTNKFKRLNIGKNRYNLGTITNTNNRYMTVRLSRILIDRLKEIYTRTWNQRVEYVGSIPFTVNNTRNYVRFNQPTARTNMQLATVMPTQEELTQYIVYHTHPVPPHVTPLFTYPSESDFRAYITNYPAIQANIILENQGYYIIDLIETNMRIPNATTVVNRFNELMDGPEFRRVRVSWSSLVYISTTAKQWKKAVNENLDPIMRKQFGISIRYYTWMNLVKLHY